MRTPQVADYCTAAFPVFYSAVDTDTRHRHPVGSAQTVGIPQVLSQPESTLINHAHLLRRLKCGLSR